MPNNGPFPSKEADRNSFYNIACPYLLKPANETRLGVSAANSATLQTAFTDWNGTYSIALNPDTRTSTAIDNKNKADFDLQTIMRKIFADIPASALTTQDRNTLNLPERAAGSPAPAPSTKPVATIDAGNRLEHSLSVVDETTPTSRAKPDGVRGCQIWEKIGSAAVEASELTYVATMTK